MLRLRLIGISMIRIAASLVKLNLYDAQNQVKHKTKYDRCNLASPACHICNSCLALSLDQDTYHQTGNK